MKSFKNLINYLVTFIVLGVMTASAQNFNFPYISPTINTNSFFNAGEFDISIAPTFSVPSLTSLGLKKMTTGYSLETEMWTTKNIGVGVELGSYNLDSYSGNAIDYIDHASVAADYRITPFSTIKYLNTWDIMLKSLAETRLDDGSKNFGLGLGIDHDIILFSHHYRLDFSLVQRFSTISKDDGFTGKIDIKLFSF
jgi:hypothetical protein